MSLPVSVGIVAPVSKVSRSNVCRGLYPMRIGSTRSRRAVLTLIPTPRHDRYGGPNREPLWPPFASRWLSLWRRGRTQFTVRRKPLVGTHTLGPSTRRRTKLSASRHCLAHRVYGGVVGTTRLQTVPSPAFGTSMAKWGCDGTALEGSLVSTITDRHGPRRRWSCRRLRAFQ